MTNQDIYPSAPPKKRVYAVGDIHGRLDLLRALIEAIEADAAKYPHRSKEIVFLGDYVDRGANPKGVIDYLIHEVPYSLQKTFLRGNHDEAFLRFIDGDRDIFNGWLLLGGAATLASYGIPATRVPLPASDIHDRLMPLIPAEHIEFLRNLKTTYRAGDYLFVHAGVKPSVPIEAQSTNDLLWIRGEFLDSSQDYGVVIVHGHTPSPEPQVRPNRIGIDTGAYATGHLTALVLQDSAHHFIMT